MIHRVAYRNFKALREVDVAFERLTVIAGQNGSGKTSILEGIELLTRVVRTNPRFVFRGASDVGVVASRGATGSFGLRLAGEWSGRPGALSIRFDGIEDYPFSDSYVLESAWGERIYSQKCELWSDATVEDDLARSKHPLGEVLPTARFLRFDARKLALASASMGATPIDEEGLGLAAVVAEMAVTRPDDFLKLQDALRAVIPGLIRVRHIRARVPMDLSSLALEADAPEDATGRWGHQIVFDMAGAPDVPARVAGEGTLLVLGTLASLIGPDRPDVVLIDHLERALHPAAARRFVEQLQLLLAEDAHLQIIATTDSPSLLDQVGGDGARITGLYPNGTAGCAALTRHPDYHLLKDDMKAGEFWMTVGERWVLDAR